MKLRVLILGYGEMGHAMEHLLSAMHHVQIWSRSGNTPLEDQVTEAELLLFCLPVNAHLEIMQRVLPCLRPNSLCLSIAKGLDEAGMTALQIFDSVLGDKHAYGVVYGPMISEEIRLGKSAFADVALSRENDFAQVRKLFQGSALICRQVADMVGSSWSVILKNVYAIMFGIADELQLGGNVRGHLMVTALTELTSIVKSLGGEAHTPYGYAGLGDLVTTATSVDSHHHELGRKLAAGQFNDISGEGVHTLNMVAKFHLFDHAAYPLYALVADIVASPEDLGIRLDEYFRQIQKW